MTCFSMNDDLLYETSLEDYYDQLQAEEYLTNIQGQLEHYLEVEEKTPADEESKEYIVSSERSYPVDDEIYAELQVEEHLANIDEEMEYYANLQQEVEVEPEVEGEDEFINENWSDTENENDGKEAGEKAEVEREEKKVKPPKFKYLPPKNNDEFITVFTPRDKDKDKLEVESEKKFKRTVSIYVPDKMDAPVLNRFSSFNYELPDEKRVKFTHVSSISNRFNPRDELLKLNGCSPLKEKPRTFLGDFKDEDDVDFKIEYTLLSEHYLSAFEEAGYKVYKPTLYSRSLNIQAVDDEYDFDKIFEDESDSKMKIKIKEPFDYYKHARGFQ